MPNDPRLSEDQWRKVTALMIKALDAARMRETSKVAHLTSVLYATLEEYLEGDTK